MYHLDGDRAHEQAADRPSALRAYDNPVAPELLGAL
jgi:hypothetical protein